MNIKKLSLLILVIILVGCRPTSAPVPTPIPPSLTSTLASHSTNTPQPTDALESLPTPVNPSTPLAESTQSLSCYQTAMTQTEMNQCASQGYQAKFAKLNALIIELKSHMNGSQYETLLKVQADWESMVEEHCKWQADFFEGGSVQSMWHANCLSQQYGYRIEALRLNLCQGMGMTGECEESLKYKE